MDNVFASDSFTVVLKENGTVQVCGNNKHGQLGLLENKPQLTPVESFKAQAELRPPISSLRKYPYPELCKINFCPGSVDKKFSNADGPLFTTHSSSLKDKCPYYRYAN